MRGVFVAGSDTGVGKTVTAAILTVQLNARYWKPVQTGVTESVTGAAVAGSRGEAEALSEKFDFDALADAQSVFILTGMGEERIIPSTYVFGAPLSPYHAAALEGKKIDPNRMNLPGSDRPLVVEGAGGLLVPITEDFFMIDLIVGLALPVVLAVRSGLGTINHTLLSLECLRSRNVPVAGVVMRGENPLNGEAIEKFGKVRVLAAIPEISPLTPSGFRSLLKTGISLDS